LEADMTGGQGSVVGLLRETKPDERRVALLPDQARQLVADGHRVLVEREAGVAAGMADEQYATAGAALVGAAEVFGSSDLIVKVKVPLPEEYGLYRPGQVLFAYLHFDENIAPERIMQIVNTGILGIAYEWVQVGSTYPLLQPMSEITGVLFAARSAELLMRHKGKLPLHSFPTQQPAAAMVIGAGHIGCNAARTFLRYGMRTTIVDKHPRTVGARLRRYVTRGEWQRWRSNLELVEFRQESPDEGVEAIRRRLPGTDIVVCSAVRRPDFPKARCEFLIDRAAVASMEPNSVVCDATACDKDFVETCISSPSLTQTDTIEGVIHYSCDHLPAYVPQTASRLLTTATFPYVRALARGAQSAIRQDASLRAGVMCCRGQLTHRLSAEKKRLPFTDVAGLLGM
jgi:alanine dehydrogenase